MALLVKNLPVNAGSIEDMGSVPGSRRSAGAGHGNPLQYSCLQNPMDRKAWWAAVHRVTQSWTGLKRLNVHACLGEGNGNPLHYSCLDNPKDRGPWRVTVHGVRESQTQLSDQL